MAVKLALEFNGEIISADSRQVYRRMNIGTGKDLGDYSVEGSEVEYHLIDITDPENEFNLFEFQQKFYQAFNLIKNKGKLPFLVGGTGLYLSSVIQHYKLKEADFFSGRAEELRGFNQDKLKDILVSLKPDIHNKTDLTDKERLIKAILVAEAGTMDYENIPSIDSVVIGIKAERAITKSRITERLKKRLEAGMIEEVEGLLRSGISFERLESFGLEYRFVSLYLKGSLNYEDMFQKLNIAIGRFAKRQMTWFRKMEREGVNISWIEAEDFFKAGQLIRDRINV